MKVNVIINKTYDVLDFFDEEELAEIGDYDVEQFKIFLKDLFYDDATELAEQAILKEVKE